VGRKRGQGVVGHRQANGGSCDEKAVVTGDMGSSRS